MSQYRVSVVSWNVSTENSKKFERGKLEYRICNVPLSRKLFLKYDGCAIQFSQATGSILGYGVEATPFRPIISHIVVFIRSL